MLDLQLTVDTRPDGSLFASYTCPCGCNPGVTVTDQTDVVTEGCCCGNQFAVGQSAASHIVERQFVARPGYQLQVQPFQAPWGQRVEAAWAVGPSTHPTDGGGHDHGHSADGGHGEHGDHAGHEGHGGHGGGHGDPGPGKAIDPVCGMTVDVEVATGKGLHVSHAGTDYYFCGRGCKLDFEEDPARILDPGYSPSM
jgi:YHS domain-containing protein